MQVFYNQIITLYIMNKLYNYVLKTLNKAIKLSLTFLCLGVIIQLLIKSQKCYTADYPWENGKLLFNYEDIYF